jgi:hypothetical protein
MYVGAIEGRVSGFGMYDEQQEKIKLFIILSESATASVFVLEGSSLKAILILEGPFAKFELESTLSLMEAEQNYELERHHRTGDNGYLEVVDFEHLQLPSLDIDDLEHMEEVEEYDDDMIEEGEDMETALKRIEKRRERNKAIRLKIQEARKKMHQRMLERAKENAYIIKSEGEPHQRTIHAITDGWYRACIRADFNNVSAPSFYHFVVICSH